MDILTQHRKDASSLVLWYDFVNVDKPKAIFWKFPLKHCTYYFFFYQNFNTYIVYKYTHIIAVLFSPR